MKQKIKSVFSIALFLFAILVTFPSEMSLVYAEDSSLSLKGDPEQNKDIYSTCGGSVNTKSSLILSAVTLCLPGLLEKGYEWRQNKCEAAVCYYEAVKNDLDPQFCISQDGYKTCKFIVGEVFALPPLAILDYYRDMIANILANPVGVLWSVTTMSARATVYGSCSGVPLSCNSVFNLPYGFASAFLVVTDIASILQTISDIAENGFFPPGIDEGENYCEKLDDIKEEIEPILKD